jgi:molybdopterin adenylyltransferase
MTFPETIKIHVVTLSDRASRGEYKDLSGPEISALISSFFRSDDRQIDLANTIIPDDPVRLETLITELIQGENHIIFTTGGTGIGPKDFTPDVVKPMLTKEIPGIMELIRVKHGMQKPNALISRSIAGVIGNCLIYVLPGSVKAVREYCAEILPTIMHSLYMIYEIDDHS